MSKIRTLIESKYDIAALSPELQLLEDAKKAGMQAAVKLLSTPKDLTEAEQKKKLIDAFKAFRKTIKEDTPFSEEKAARSFMSGFQDANQFEEDN